MGRINKEQAFFLATFLLLAFLAYGLWNHPYRRVQPERGEKVDEIQSVALLSSPEGKILEDWLKTERAVFQEPRDWFPLPPVDLPRPPLSEPSVVIPYPEPSVGIERLGAYRTRLTVTDHAFGEESTEAAPPEDPAVSESAAARARVESLVDEEAEFKRRYDWIETRTGRAPWFGIIKNRDKYRLAQRTEEAVEFQRVDPESGRLQGLGKVEREVLKENGIHFADNVVNRVELAFLELPQEQWLGTGSLPRLLSIAERVMALGNLDSYAYQRARAELERFRELDPKAPRVHELLADCQHSLFDFEAEIRVLNEADQLGVVSSGLLRRRALWLWDHGAMRRAVDLLKSAISKDPGDHELKLLLGQFLVEQGRGEEALAMFRETESLAEDKEQRLNVHLWIGESLLHAGMIKEAEEQAEKKVLAVLQDDVRGLRLLSGARFAAQKFDESLGLYQKLLDQTESFLDESQALLGLGLTLAQRGDFEESARRLQASRLLNPLAGARARLAEAFLYARGNALERAVEACSQAVRMDPDDPHARYFLGRLMRVNGDFETARGELKRALDLGASFSDLFNELAYLSLLDSRPVDAVRYCEESLAREDRAETSTLLAHSLVEADRLIEARRVFDTLHGKRPTPDSQLGIAFCAYRQGDSAGAQKMLLELKDLFENAEEDRLKYAEVSLAEIIDRESKSQWEDFILWRQVGNGWSLQERFGVAPRISTGSFRLQGTQKSGTSPEQWTYLERAVSLHSGHEVEVELTLNPGNQGKCGLALVHFIQGGPQGTEPQKRAALIVNVDATGGVSVRSGKNLEELAQPAVAVGKIDVADSTPVVLGIRRPEKGSAKFEVLVNGAPMGEAVEMESWRGAKLTVSALFFASAEGGRNVDVTMKHARIVRYGDE